MSKIKSLYRILKSKSLKYLLFRSKYEIERKIGILAWKYPTRLKSVSIPSLAEWKMDGCGWFFEGRGSLCFQKQKSPVLKAMMEHILKGDTLFFSKTWKPLGLDYDWVTNPETGYRYDERQHWTKVNDFSEEAGDIKFVWEKSRFSWLLTVCRFDYHFEEDHSEFVLVSILDWIEKNPLNCGPNYKCSQEISIRILNWLFALSFYRNRKNLTEERWKTIMISIYWQIDHVMKNIDFSRIAVRNNHAITETLTLYLMGVLFPQMPHAVKWKKSGKRWFEQEIDYQIEEDGTFIQDSMNYHRVVIQLLTYAIALADKHNETFSDTVYKKAYKSLDFLYQCQEPTSGWLPNYGANDGALFFPLSDLDYRDYRPQLDALHGFLTGESLYQDYLEDAQWVNAKVPPSRKAYPKLEKRYGFVTFKKGGYYLIREKETLTFIRCGLFKTNGSRDQLHLDVWHKGANILIDGGSYMYNTDEDTVRYFSGTESHNTIMIGNYDQMQKGSRFMWFYPPTVSYSEFKEDCSDYRFVGKIVAFKQYNESGVTICREIIKKKESAEWVVLDTIEGAPDNLLKRQLWHTDSELEIVSDGSIKEKEGWVSDYYGVKRNVRQIEAQTLSKQVLTRIKVKE